MTTEEDNRSIDRFVKLLFGSEVQWLRPDNNIWPDGILPIDNRRVALELTELISSKDKIHTNRKKLENNEHTLEQLLEAKMRTILKESGALLSVSINLDIPRLTVAKVKDLADQIFREIELSLDHRNITTAIKREHFRIEEHDSDVEIILSRRWSQIKSNVGFRGCHPQNLSHD